MTASTLFLSYSRADSALARQVGDGLIDRGYRLWMDERMPGGEAWREEIDRALLAAKFLIVVFSRAAHESGWVTYECATAIARGVPILVVLADSTGLSPWLRDAPVADFRQVHRWEDLVGHLPAADSSHDLVSIPDFDAARYTQVVEQLAEIPGLDATKQLIAGLRHELPRVRVMVGRKLRERTLDEVERRAVAMAFVRNLADFDPPTRGSAILGLAATGEMAEVAPRLVRIFECEESLDVREIALRALGQAGVCEGVEPVIRACLQASEVPPSNDLPRVAIEALEHLGAAESLPVIREYRDRLVAMWRSDDKARDALLAALQAGRRVGGPREASEFLRLLGDERLCSDLVVSESFVGGSVEVEPAAYVAAHLIAMGARELLPSLQEKAESASDSERFYSLVAIRGLLGPESVPLPLLEQALQDGGPFSRQLAAQLLGKREDVGQEKLVKALGSGCCEVRAVAASFCRDCASVDSLISLLEDSSPVIQGSIAVLGQLSWGVRDIDHRDSLLRSTPGREAAFALRRFRTDEARAAFESWCAGQDAEDWPFGLPEF